VFDANFTPPMSDLWRMSGLTIFMTTGPPISSATSSASTGESTTSPATSTNRRPSSMLSR